MLGTSSLQFAEDDIRRYVESQTRDERVESAVRVTNRFLYGKRYDIWDVRTDEGRWWVVTPLTNLYSQDAFPSMDFAFTYHLGVERTLGARSLSAEQHENIEGRFALASRKASQAGQALDQAEEAEDFQAVGMRLREVLRTLARDLAEAVPASRHENLDLKAGDFVGWSGRFVDLAFVGEGRRHHRKYLKGIAKTTWDLAQWLTHAVDATRADGEMAFDATDHLFATFMVAIVKRESAGPSRCPECASYRVTEWFQRDESLGEFHYYYVTVCEACDWESEPHGHGA